MNALRQQAKSFRDSKNYNDAVKIYNQLWETEDNECKDKWTCWEFADALRRTKNFARAIEICNEAREIDANFNYINNTLSWCIYEVYVKELKSNIDFIKENKILEKAKFNTEITTQNKNSSYESTCIKVIKFLKSKTAYPSKELLFWLEKLDVNLLSEAPYEKENKKGRSTEVQSKKEMFYSCKSKALFEEKLYKDCINCCEEALNCGIEFHHDNEMWIKSRKAKSLFSLGETETAITIYKEVSVKKNHWSLLHELGEMYEAINDFDNAILYFSRAVLTNDPPKMKVKLLCDIAKLLEKFGNIEYAYLFNLYVKEVREKEGWRIDNILVDNIQRTKIDTDKSNNLKHNIKEFCMSEVERMLGVKKGRISNIHPNGKIGFIESDSRFFFKTSSFVNNKKYRIGDNVQFVLVDSFDLRKNIFTKEANYIKDMGEQNGKQ